MSLEVEYFDIDSSAATNRYVELAGVVVSATNVALDTISGTAQALNDDFAVDTTTASPTVRVKWDSPSYGLYSQITLGDQIRVIYDRS